MGAPLRPPAASPRSRAELAAARTSRADRGHVISRSRTASKFSMHLPAPMTTHSSGASTRWTGSPVSSESRRSRPFSMAAAADEVEALAQQVLRQFGGRRPEAPEHRVHDRSHLLLDRFTDLFRGEDDGLGQAAHQVTPPDLGLHGVVHGPRRADSHLDLLGRALADGDAVLPAHVGLDGGVDVEAAHPDRFKGDDAAKRDDGRLGRPAPNVARPCCPRGWWIGRPAPMAAAVGCSMRLTLLAPAARAASSTARRSTAVMADGTQMSTLGRPKREIPARFSRSSIIRCVMSKSVMAPLRNGPHRHYVARSTPDHLPRLAAHVEHGVGAAVQGDHGGLVEDDAASFCVDERVGGAQVDGEVPRQVLASPLVARTERSSCAVPGPARPGPELTGARAVVGATA